MDIDTPRQHRPSRRRFLLLAGGTLAAPTLLSACGTDDTEAQPTPEATFTVHVPATAKDGTPEEPPATPTPSPSATPSPTATPTEPSGPTLEEKIGQMVMGGFRGYRLNDPGTADPVADLLASRNLGGVILFDYDVTTGSSERNIESPAQVAALSGDVRGLATGPVFISTDQEGGNVARLDEEHGFPATVAPADLGQVNDPEYTYGVTAVMAQTLAAAGINLNLAPLVDLNVNPDNPVIGALGRSFSADPDIVTAQATAFIEAHHDNGVLTALKHFPGHGSSTADSHLGFVDVTATWSEVELEPYANLIASGIVDAIMTAHVFNANLDPDYPATLSRPTITGILREQLGFAGVVFSDDMQMAAITAHYGFEEAIGLAINAGVDIIGIGNNLDYDPGIVARALDTITALVGDGTISEARIDESYARIQALKQRLPA